MDEIDHLIETLEILRDAISAKDSEKGFEAVTILLMQFMGTFGHDPAVFAQVFPLLEQLKVEIQSRNFDEAEVIVLALLAKFRQVKEIVDDPDREMTI